MDKVSEYILYSIEYIPGIFYFATVRPGRVIQSDSQYFFFTIDDELVYQNFYSDFGPLNLGCVYKYCCKLNEIFRVHLRSRKVVHYTCTDPKKKANAAFLIGCYGVLCLELTPRDAFRALCAHGQTYKPFQDATQGDSLYTITILDCLNAICKAKDLGLLNLLDFDVQEYDRLDNIRGGDLNWIVPDKFLAFIGPVDHALSPYHPPEIYLDYFLENDIRIVIRLNKKFYDEQVFEHAGIKHYDMFFPDGSCPPRHIVYKFLQIAEDNPGVAIAVHCKAGLGRTGSLIGCYLIKHYKMSARESIAWMRICRPGSVIGHQQGWLEQLEPWLAKEGNLYRKKVWNDRNKLPYHEFGLYSLRKRKWQEDRKVTPDIQSRANGTMTKSQSKSSSPIPKMVTEETFIKTDGNGRRYSQNSDNYSEKQGDRDDRKRRFGTSVSGRSSPVPERRYSQNDRREQYFVNKNANYFIDTANRIASRSTSIKMPKPRSETQTWKAGGNIADRNRSRTSNESNRNLRTPPSPSKQNRPSQMNNSLQCTVVPGLPNDFVKENITSCIRGANKEALGVNWSNRNRSPSPLYKRERAGSKEVTLVTTPESINSYINTQNKPNVVQTRTSNMRTKSFINRDRSVGAASLDARRQLGATETCSRSVKSDDQTRITQGDFLNSIKNSRAEAKNARTKDLLTPAPSNRNIRGRTDEKVKAFERQLRRIANRSKEVSAGIALQDNNLKRERCNMNLSRSSNIQLIRSRVSDPCRMKSERITVAPVTAMTNNKNRESAFNNVDNESITSKRYSSRSNSPLRTKTFSLENSKSWRQQRSTD